MPKPYTPPTHRATSFNCPFCGAFSAQAWDDAAFYQRVIGTVGFCRCEHCKQISIWHTGKMIYPDEGGAPRPNPDLPEKISEDYEEARRILGKSPRGAAALLRLAVQRLCQHLGESGKDLNTDIGSLVRKGLPERVRQALDALRVIGNNAVHPGQIDLTDDGDTAAALFGLVNFIAEKMISEPREIERLHALIPTGTAEQIKKRDGRPAS